VLVLLTVAYVRNFFGFVLGFFVCLVSFCQIPSFDRFHGYKILAFSLLNGCCWLVLLVSLYLSTNKQFDYLRFQLNLQEQEVQEYFGAYIPYRRDSTSLVLLDFDQIKKGGKDFYFNLAVLVFALTSGFILYRLKLGSLADGIFKAQITNERELPPECTFRERNPRLEQDMKDSYYVNYFIKKISLIMAIDLKSAIDEKDNILIAYLKTVPYVDTKALGKKMRMFTAFKRRGDIESDFAGKKILTKLLEFVLETLTHIFTLSNVIYASLFAYVAFFFYFKNLDPTVYSFLSFVGIFLLGITSFNTFIFYSQFLVGVPMILNFMLFYFSNLKLDIFSLQNSTPEAKLRNTWLGFIRKPVGFAESELFTEMLIKIVLFQGIFFFYRSLKFTEELFIEKKTKELNLEIEDQFNKGSLPFIRIIIIQIASKFYVICFLLMLYIGTSQTTYTNMVILILLITYVSKFKLVAKWWLFIYIIMNFIFIVAYFIDLFLTEDQKKAHVKLLRLVGLPINTIAGVTSSSNALSEGNIRNKLLLMVLYICCLVQQIAGQNLYIRCYLIKLDKMKNDNWLVSKVNNWKQQLKVFVVKFYYKGGVWISYGLNIYLPLFQSISISRALLLTCIIVAFIVHITALRKAIKTGQVFLDTTYFCWKVFLVLKVLNLSMVIIGAFGLTENTRELLGIVKDSADYEIINYIGIESLEPDIIGIIPTLQNCSRDSWISANKLRFYFIAECLTFILTKIAMKIINVQRIYNNDIFSYVKNLNSLALFRQRKPKLYNIYKIYHRYIIGGRFLKHKKANQLIGSFNGFLARIYTSVIYIITLAISIFKNISLLMFIYLYFFLSYFIEMNKIFLDYLTNHSVEKVLEISTRLFIQNSTTSTRSISLTTLLKTRQIGTT
jgi:hypothetical protein